MKPAWSKPPKTRIRRGYKAQTHDSLSGVAVVEDVDSYPTGYTVNIAFDERDVDRLRKVMPRGIGPAEPAYLYATNLSGQWAVFCNYFHDDYRALLWLQDKRPLWLPKPRKTKLS